MFKKFNTKFSHSYSECRCGTVVLGIAFEANGPGSNLGIDCFFKCSIIMFLI